ncbi:NYN domain-containing protein [Aromatoleum diolicum]|uniref:NYN domain-containing protein n=1 Tax=Aromatoleum diolicum TaxID=75796 RepID=A0ABX1QCM4_9RHOO|nr:NYN domain-containing protein [Aromatoleum diolicum]NMG74939.1 NYN domain-containing protein [Aromatoleum diolicum]
MASSHDNVSMALFCDFENVALGVRDAKYEKFDIKPVLERLLLKGSIVVKKAYCDWDRYKGFKAAMHEANFELIEIPHVRQSGKNSADIRLVVDALDLCYTKSHVNTFVIISGDSDFSPLVSKLRENAKQVIGVGVKQSTSDLLIANCDEFIFYDDLVREIQRTAAKRETREAQPAAKRPPEEEKRRKDELEARKTKAIEMAVETFDALVSERGDSGVRIWASMLKEAIKRRKPDFNESYYGFRAFGNLLEEAQARGLLEFGRDEKSGAYVYRSSKPAAGEVGAEAPEAVHPGQVIDTRPQTSEKSAIVAEAAPEATTADETGARHEPRRKSRGGRKSSPKKAEAAAVTAEAVRAEVAMPEAAITEAGGGLPETAKPDGRRTRRGKSQAAKPENARPDVAQAEPVAAMPEARAMAEPSIQPEQDEAPAKPAKKSAPRSRRPRKTETQQT